MMARQLFLLILALSAGCALAAEAAPSLPSSRSTAKPAAKPTIESELAILEGKFLTHDYAHDPPDKRLQRLELLFFGATQLGSNEDRLKDLKSNAAERSKAKSSGSAADLNRLEQKILKKSFAGETAEQRVARLEQRVFGKASPALTLSDRIERLKKTLGIGEVPPIAQMPESMPEFDDGIMVPFGDARTQQMNKRFNDMIKQLHRQMRSMPHMPQSPDTFTSPFSSPFGDGLIVPRHSDDENKLPPYLDPNSI